MKLLHWIGLGVALLGAAFVAFGVWAATQDRSQIAQSRSVTGTVVALEYERDGDGGYRGVVRFTTDDGREVDIRSRNRSRPAAFRVGERVRVFYDPAHPEGALIDSFAERWLLTLIFSGLGSVALAAGLSILGYLWFSARRDRRLRERGQRVAGRVLGVELNPALRINGAPARRVRVEWIHPATGKPRSELSANLSYDPTPWLAERIDVYLDPSNPRRYLIDLAPTEAASQGA